MFTHTPDFIKDTSLVELTGYKGVEAWLAIFDKALCRPHFWQLFLSEFNIDISQMRQKRCADFVAGRYLAFLALQKLGIDCIVGVSSDNAPIWPAKICGSISHSNNHAVVIIKKKSHEYEHLGVDIEVLLATEKAERLYLQFMNPDEVNFYHNHLNSNESLLDFNLFATLVFSAKEAVYKAYHPMINSFFGFDAISIIGFNKIDLMFKINNSFKQSISLTRPDLLNIIPEIIKVNWQFIEGGKSNLKHKIVCCWVLAGKLPV
ncbi:4'-phosphopantetheinyl transferase superfamily protein [Catenovulum sp. 2E275]|uniref:4'-phosphopantetheinyl transferase family protein n=1 Tax=Catenovulum sp. 2E275 TaxID=2980497 RepID=UPI0021CE473C|nr:4'-phosphopantetheinyl transferase superfamily protein [Catenovulum sp. 2E275]MCU4674123.1 4'-phosphopantetheinyl transferase superfamily protein [Catenovulum sp. 2E275]